jgi:hypothetical protein
LVARNSFVMCVRDHGEELCRGYAANRNHMETHPKESRARILLSSVFGPYAQDDEFGSRSINPMELYHNQVTRAQGSFSLRMFHRSWGIMLIQDVNPTATSNRDPASNVSPSAMGRVFQTGRVSRTR